MSEAHGTSGMDDMANGDGLSAEGSGLRFVPGASSLQPGTATDFTFQITDADGEPVTTFEPDQTKLMHLYLIRSDLIGFQHLHPTMSDDGTWTAPIEPVMPGTYRAYASFAAKDDMHGTVPLVLSSEVTAPGADTTTPLPPASSTADVDGYTLTVESDQLVAGSAHDFMVSVSKDGQPVEDLQPYLDTYAHLTAFHAGDLAFAHLHPMGMADDDHGGPDLTFEAALPKSGDWRLFLQFQTGDVLHTAALTIPVS
jgi:hypothetical protein